MNFNEQGEAAGRKYVDFITKWNPRLEDKREWLEMAEKQASWTQDREGKHTGIFTVDVEIGVEASTTSVESCALSSAR